MIRPPVIGCLYFVILYEGGISLLKRQPLFVFLATKTGSEQVTLTLKRNEKVHKKDLKKVEVWFTMELSGEKW